MTVELVGIANSEKRVLNQLPALLHSDTSSEGSPDGSYRCLITEVEDHLVVWDLGSKGGTFVNGVPVTKASLSTSDTLRLGGREFSVRYEYGPRRYMFGVRC
jgi:hypothetical protein